MESNANTSKDQKLDSGNSGSTVTSQVLEYYNNFSQSENLSRYLRGSKNKKTHSFEDLAVADCSRPQLIGENRSETDEVGLDINKQGNENKEISPTSSLASNRKLEWDNGADIGYKNVQNLQKSLSLPVLSSAGKVNIHEEFLRLSPEGINSSAEQAQQQPTMSKFPLNVQNNQGLIMLPESSGDDSPVEPKNKIIPSSSSSSLKLDHIQPNLYDLSSSGDDIPLAVSTPFDNHNYKQTCVSKLEKQKNDKSKNECIEMSTKEKNRGRIFKLQISKPIYVDCFNEETSYSNKNIQTSLKDLSSKLVQTDTVLSQIHPKNNKISEKRDGTYLEHELIKENPSSSYPSQPSSASSESKCESFQYLNAEEYHPNQMENLKSIDIENMIEQKEGPSYNYPSGSKTQQANHLQTNVCSSGEPTEKLNKGINLIKKLIKSQKYDSTTKRQYINMIIKKIIEQNCSDESTDSVSSPKYDLNKSTIEFTPPTNSTSDLSDSPKEKSTRIMSKTNHKRVTKRNILHQNRPWIPISKSSDINLDYKEALNFQTFSNEIVAPEEQEKLNSYNKTELPCEDQKISSAYEKLKKSHYTMVSDEVQKSNCVKGKGDSNHHSNLNLHQKYEFPEKCNVRDWNQNKTHAENVLGKCSNSSDSYNDSETVTRFAKHEKLHQLNWIKCEIAYLSKLKNLLETTNGYLSSSCVDSNEVKGNNSDSNTLMKNSSDRNNADNDNFEALTAVDLKSFQKGPTQKTNTIYLITTERLKDSTGKLPQSKLITEEELLNSNDKNLKILNNFVRQLVIDNKSEIQQDNKLECNKLTKELTEANSESLPFDIQKARLISTTVHTIVNTNNSQKTLVKRYTFEISEENASAHKNYDKVSTSNTSSSIKHNADVFHSHAVDNQSTSSSTKPSDMNGIVSSNNTDFIKKDPHKKNENLTTIKTNVIYKRNQSRSPDLCNQNDENKIMIPNDNKNTAHGKIQTNNVEECFSENNKTHSDFQKKIIHLQETIDQKEQELKEIKSLLSRNILNVHNHVPAKLEVKVKKNSLENADQNNKISEVSVKDVTQKEKTKILPRKGSVEDTIDISKNVNNVRKEQKTYSEHDLTNSNKLNKNSPSEETSISSQSYYPEQEISDEVTSLKSSCDDSKTQYVSSEEKYKENDKCDHQKQATKSQSDHTYETSKTTCCCKDDEKVIVEIKDVVTKLNRLIKEENECCKCLYNNKTRSKSSSNAINKAKLPVAYTLILEECELKKNIENNKNSGRNRKTRPLQEIRIKLPLPHSKKKTKKAKHTNHRKRKENSFADLQKHENENAEYEYDDNNVPLYEYLHKNRPQFIQSAEERRKCIYELAFIREQCRQKYKELLALTDGIPLSSSINRNDSKPKKLFTSAEMRQMTNKKYKHLPEVQKKLRDNKNEQIKYANRILLNIFTKKLKDRVLSGETNISLQSSIV